jgi:hypothetical protein
MTGFKKAVFPTVFVTIRLPGLIFATDHWWLIWQFLAMQNVPLFPIIALQIKLNKSRS